MEEYGKVTIPGYSCIPSSLLWLRKAAEKGDNKSIEDVKEDEELGGKAEAMCEVLGLSAKAMEIGT